MGKRQDETLSSSFASSTTNPGNRGGLSSGGGESGLPSSSPNTLGSGSEIDGIAASTEEEDLDPFYLEEDNYYEDDFKPKPTIRGEPLELYEKQNRRRNKNAIDPTFEESLGTLNEGWETEILLKKKMKERQNQNKRKGWFRRLISRLRGN